MKLLVAILLGKQMQRHTQSMSSAINNVGLDVANLLKVGFRRYCIHNKENYRMWGMVFGLTVSPEHVNYNIMLSRMQ